MGHRASTFSLSNTPLRVLIAVGPLHRLLCTSTDWGGVKRGCLKRLQMEHTKCRAAASVTAAAALACLALSPGALADMVGARQAGAFGTSEFKTTELPEPLAFRDPAETLPDTDLAAFLSRPGVSLGSVGLGLANAGCAGLSAGQSCSVFAPSLLILTDPATGAALSLPLIGMGHDSASSVADDNGPLTAGIGAGVPARLQAMFAAGGAGGDRARAPDALAATQVPEPNSAMLLGAVLIGALVVIRRLAR